ncbi:MAG: hypothetical protein Q9175_003480 [Cornicularia normoerica]
MLQTPKSYDALLEELSKDGKMDYAEWPGLLERLLSRLEQVAYNDFPTPSIPLPGSRPPSLKDEHVSDRREPLLKEEPFKDRPSFQEETGHTKREGSEKEEQAGTKADPSIEDSRSAIKRESSPTTNSQTPSHHHSSPSSAPSNPPSAPASLPPHLTPPNALQSFSSAPHTTTKRCPLTSAPLTESSQSPVQLRSSLSLRSPLQLLRMADSSMARRHQVLIWRIRISLAGLS